MIEEYNTFLDFEAQEIRDKLIELGFIKIITEPHEHFNKEQWDEFNYSNQPVWLYYNFKDTRKQKLKFEYYLIGNWHFKMFLLTSKLNINHLLVMEEYPSLKNFLSLGEISFSLNKIRREFKKILEKEFIKICNEAGRFPENWNKRLKEYQKEMTEVYGL